MIDKNEKAIEAMAYSKKGDKKKAKELEKEFLKEVEQKVEDHCPCTAACEMHGDCKTCVTVHRGHTDHLPFCFHEMINERLSCVASLTEHKLEKAD